MLGENTIVFYTVDQSSVSWCICLSYWGLDLIRVYSQTLKSCFVILAIYQSNKQTKMVPFEGCTVVQQVAMPPPSSRISAQVTVCADIRLVSVLGFLWFSPTFQKHAARWISYAKLSRGVLQWTTVLSWVYSIAPNIPRFGSTMTLTQIILFDVAWLWC